MRKQKQRRQRRNIAVNDDINALLEMQSRSMGLSVSGYIALVTKLVDKKGIEHLVAAK